MTTYSLLFIDANEHIGRSRQIECPTDEQAVDMAAKESGDYRAIQVWDGDRPIVLIGNPRNLGEDLFAPVLSTRQHSTLESDGAPTSD